MQIEQYESYQRFNCGNLSKSTSSMRANYANAIINRRREILVMPKLLPSASCLMPHVLQFSSSPRAVLFSSYSIFGCSTTPTSEGSFIGAT